MSFLNFLAANAVPPSLARKHLAVLWPALRYVGVGFCLLVFALSFLLPGMPVAAQSIDAKVDFYVVPAEEQTTFTVGDYITLRLEVRHPVDSQVQLPQLGEQWERLEVISQSPPSTVTNNDGTSVTGKDIVVALYEPG